MSAASHEESVQQATVLPRPAHSQFQPLSAGPGQCRTPGLSPSIQQNQVNANSLSVCVVCYVEFDSIAVAYMYVHIHKELNYLLTINC